MDLLGKRIYLQPMGMVLDTINDIVELQKGKLTYSDTPHGNINFLVKMYAFKWELSFTVTDIGKNRSQVQIEIDGDTRSKEKLILREFALLDSMLIAGAQIEITDKEDDDKKKYKKSETRAQYSGVIPVQIF